MNRTRACQAMILFLAAAVCSVILAPAASAADKWPGVDETVVENIAKEHGREAHRPLIDTDQGDMLLFVFLIAGAVGGFAGGYYWRALITEGRPGAQQRGKEAGS